MPSDGGGIGSGGKPLISPVCMCGYVRKKHELLCPRCWPDKQPKDTQLEFDLGEV